MEQEIKRKIREQENKRANAINAKEINSKKDNKIKHSQLNHLKERIEININCN